MTTITSSASPTLKTTGTARCFGSTCCDSPLLPLSTTTKRKGRSHLPSELRPLKFVPDHAPAAANAKYVPVGDFVLKSKVPKLTVPWEDTGIRGVRRSSTTKCNLQGRRDARLATDAALVEWANSIATRYRTRAKNKHKYRSSIYRRSINNRGRLVSSSDRLAISFTTPDDTSTTPSLLGSDNNIHGSSGLHPQVAPQDHPYRRGMGVDLDKFHSVILPTPHDGPGTVRSAPKINLAAKVEQSVGDGSIDCRVPVHNPMTRPTDRTSPPTLPPTPFLPPTPSTTTSTSCLQHQTAPHSFRKKIPSLENPQHNLNPWLSTFQNWDNAERLLALREVIKLCQPSQIRHMMKIIEPLFQRDFISLLPKELALYVLSFLSPEDLLRSAQACTKWRLLAQDNLLWREKCRELNIRDALYDAGTRHFDASQPRVSDAGDVLRTKQNSTAHWKNIYITDKRVETNWRRKSIDKITVLKGHDDHVITCLQFDGEYIVSGSDDNTLKVWSTETGECVVTLVGHTGGVWSSEMRGKTVISGSTDRTLKVWDIESGKCLHTLFGHTSTVRCMSLRGNKVVSGSRDATLRVWDIVTGACLGILVGHVAAVRCVQYDGRRVVSGAYDYLVKVWNPETEECIHTLHGHNNRVYSLQFDGVHIVSGSLDTSIRIWDVESGNCLHTLIGHQSLTSRMELKNNILVSGNADSTVKIWDISTGQCLHTLQGTNKHQSAVTCLQFDSKTVVTSSDDGTVKLWDAKTGEFIRDLVHLDSGGSGGVVWRIKSTATKLVCAVGSRNGTEDTKLLVLNFGPNFGSAKEESEQVTQTQPLPLNTQKLC